MSFLLSVCYILMKNIFMNKTDNSAAADAGELSRRMGSETNLSGKAFLSPIRQMHLL